METDLAAKQLAELGNPHRLLAYRLLVKAGEAGLTVGEIQAHLQIPASTLSHHLAHLIWADLVVQEREGRALRCRANFAAMRRLVGFLVDECCTGVTATGCSDACAVPSAATTPAPR